MLLEDSGREALFYHRLQISYQPVTILTVDMPELKETLEKFIQVIKLKFLNPRLILVLLFETVFD